MQSSLLNSRPLAAGIMAVYEEECSSRVSGGTGSQMGAERYIFNRFCNGNGNR